MHSTGGDLPIFMALQKPFKFSVPLSRSLPGPDAELCLGSSHGRHRISFIPHFGVDLALQLWAAAQHVREPFCRVAHCSAFFLGHSACTEFVGCDRTLAGPAKASRVG